MSYVTEVLVIILLIAVWLAISFDFQFEIIRVQQPLNNNAQNLLPNVQHKIHFKFNVMKKNVQYFKSLLTANQVQKVIKYLIASYIVYICLPTIQAA